MNSAYKTWGSGGITHSRSILMTRNLKTKWDIFDLIIFYSMNRGVKSIHIHYVNISVNVRLNMKVKT